jgi:uncharacterized protein YciI
MAEPGYPHSAALIPERRDEHTIVFLVRPPDAPDFSEEELDRLQVEHLTHLRDLTRRGLLIANGPLVDQTNASFRGISIYRVPLDEALALANVDPMVRAGRLAVEGARWWTAAGDVAFGRPPQPG